MTKFGVAIEAPIDWPDLLALAQEIDRNSRYDFLWISDALYANGLPDDPKLDAWIALAAIAQTTSRVRLGVLVSGNVYRHPSLVAKMATTLDHISNGRLELGLGAGWPGENPRFGIPFGTRHERRERLIEALHVIKLLWSQDKPVFAGKHYSLDAPHYSPKNIQQPHPPITVGAGQEDIIRAAVVDADAINPMINMRDAVTLIEQYARDAGRRPASIRRSLEVQFFMNDDPAMQRRALDWAKQQHQQDEDSVRRQSLFGSADEVRDSVRRHLDAGAQELYLFQLPRVHLKSLLRFSDEIIPEFA